MRETVEWPSFCNELFASVASSTTHSIIFIIKENCFNPQLFQVMLLFHTPIAPNVSAYSAISGALTVAAVLLALLSRVENVYSFQF
jgi:hypothetical protein